MKANPTSSPAYPPPPPRATAVGAAPRPAAPRAPLPDLGSDVASWALAAPPPADCEYRQHPRRPYLADALRDIVFLRGCRGRLCRVEFAQISYLAADGAYTSVILRDGRKFLVDRTLSALLGAFDRDDLLRVHKSYAVPVHAIAEACREELVVSSGESLPIGRTYRAELFACLTF